MKKTLMLVMFLSLTVFFIVSGETENTKNAQYEISYYGEFLTHPGLSLEIIKPLAANDRHSLTASIRFGGYSHYLNHSALFLGSQLGYNFRFKNGFELEVQGGASYMHRFYGATVYSVDSGNLNEESNWGVPRLMPHFSFGSGIPIKKTEHQVIRLYSNLEFSGEYPYNSYLLPHIAWQTGIRFSTGAHNER